MDITLERFRIEDVDCLKEIMDLNVISAGTRQKDYKKFIEWNIKDPTDLYWKVVLKEHDDSIMIGYIGYDDALRKDSTKNVANPGDLFLEIYFHPDYTGKGIGKQVFDLSIDLLPESKNTILASTYITNVRAQKFFKQQLSMNVLPNKYSTKKFNVIIFTKEISRY